MADLSFVKRIRLSAAQQRMFRDLGLAAEFGVDEKRSMLLVADDCRRILEVVPQTWNPSSTEEKRTGLSLRKIAIDRLADLDEAKAAK